MNLISKYAACATLAVLAFAPVAAHADHASRRAHASAVQGNKNTMRNLAIGGAAVAGYGLLNHNTTATILGAAGAALAGSQYENARKEQSQQFSRYENGYENGRRYHYHR